MSAIGILKQLPQLVPDFPDAIELLIVPLISSKSSEATTRLLTRLLGQNGCTIAAA